MNKLLPILMAAALLGACSRGDDAAEQPSPEVTEKFAARHFLQYLNQQPTLAPGDYTLAVRTAGGTVAFAIDVTLDDGSTTTHTGTVGPAETGAFGVSLPRAGGLRAGMTGSGAACLFLVRGGLVLFRDGDSQTIDNDCDTGATTLALDLPASKTNDASYAQAYYDTIDPTGARDTLAGFQAANGFGAGDTHVIFRDTKDLGYGRDMYFHAGAVAGTYAFYVNNFVVTDLPGQTYGPLNLDAAIAQIDKYHIGTNAIEYGPIDIDGTPGDDDVNGDGAVDKADYFPRFYNYSPDPPYERRDTVDLDGKGEKAMPVPCIVCHGGRADALLPDGSFPRSGDTFSQLQPLDVGTFEFSDESPWTRAEVEVGLKTINTAVYHSYEALQAPPPGQWDSSMAREMLENWYGPLLDQAFNDTYVPDDWQPDPGDGSPPAGADDLYRDVLSTNCRTCHLLRGLSHQSDIDFTSWDKFVGYNDRVQELVYDEGLMPLATLTFDNFHDSGFMAEMLASFLPNFTRHDAAGALLLPGRPIAKAGPDRRSPEPVTVSGAASLFADEYDWTLVSQPVGANASLTAADAEGVRARLENAIDGVYVLQLVVNDGVQDSDPDTVTVAVDSTMNPAPAQLSFATDIAPVLTSAGCTSCHQPGGNGLVVPPVFYTPGPNRDVYATVRSLINFDNPERSRLLLKPSGHHHAGSTLTGFDLDGNRTNYDLFLNWILEGAKQ